MLFQSCPAQISPSVKSLLHTHQQHCFKSKSFCIKNFRPKANQCENHENYQSRISPQNWRIYEIMKILLHWILICCIILSTFTTHIHISLLQKYMKHKYIVFKRLNSLMHSHPQRSKVTKEYIDFGLFCTKPCCFV